MIDLLRPRMHHEPIHMLQVAEHRHLLVPGSLVDVRKRDVVSECLPASTAQPPRLPPVGAPSSVSALD